MSFIVGAVVFGVFAAGCSGGTSSCAGGGSSSGGSDKLTATEFADKTCTDLAAWAGTSTDALTALRNVEVSEGDASAAQNLSQTFATLEQATTTLMSSIRSRPVGRPSPEMTRVGRCRTGTSTAPVCRADAARHAVRCNGTYERRS
jgi:hypothetical protein